MGQRDEVLRRRGTAETPIAALGLGLDGYRPSTTFKTRSGCCPCWPIRRISAARRNGDRSDRPASRPGRRRTIGGASTARSDLGETSAAAAGWKTTFSACPACRRLRLRVPAAAEAQARPRNPVLPTHGSQRLGVDREGQRRRSQFDRARRARGLRSFAAEARDRNRYRERQDGHEGPGEGQRGQSGRGMAEFLAGMENGLRGKAAGGSCDSGTLLYSLPQGGKKPIAEGRLAEQNRLEKRVTVGQVAFVTARSSIPGVEFGPLRVSVDDPVLKNSPPLENTPFS